MTKGKRAVITAAWAAIGSAGLMQIHVGMHLYVLCCMGRPGRQAQVALALAENPWPCWVKAVKWQILPDDISSKWDIREALPCAHGSNMNRGHYEVALMIKRRDYDLSATILLPTLIAAPFNHG